MKSEVLISATSTYKKETQTTYSLNSVTSLIKRRIDPNGNVVEEKIFPLSEISEEDLLKKRQSKEPGFVLKMEDTLYYAKITKKTKLLCSKSTQDRSHLCAHCNLSSFFNCIKVKEVAYEFYNSEEKLYLNTLKFSKRIEKYNFITYGFETFNVSPHNVFCVFRCENFNLSNDEIKSQKPLESKSCAI